MARPGFPGVPDLADVTIFCGRQRSSPLKMPTLPRPECNISWPADLEHWSTGPLRPGCHFVSQVLLLRDACLNYLLYRADMPLPLEPAAEPGGPCISFFLWVAKLDSGCLCDLQAVQADYATVWNSDIPTAGRSSQSRQPSQRRGHTHTHTNTHKHAPADAELSAVFTSRWAMIRLVRLAWAHMTAPLHDSTPKTRLDSPGSLPNGCRVCPASAVISQPPPAAKEPARS